MVMYNEAEEMSFEHRFFFECRALCIRQAYALDLCSPGAWHSLKNETQSGNHTNQFWRMLASLCFLIGMLDHISCAVPNALAQIPCQIACIVSQAKFSNDEILEELLMFSQLSLRDFLGR